jgi:uncharacterized protein (TIGR00255 family)
MIRSMTGFAAVSRETERASVGVTIRTLNHRYVDLQLRLPQSLAGMESRVRAMVQERIGRGRVELTVSVQFREQAVEVEFNESLVTALAAAIDAARSRGLVAGALTPGDLLRVPQALAVRERSIERDAAVMAEIGEIAVSAVEQGLSELDAMRATEGAHLHADLEGRRSALALLVEAIAEAADEGRAELQTRLAARVQELASDLPVDQTAIAQEVVRTAARSDISEEATRFRGHLAHWATLVGLPEPCGRKLDFLLQEMNREVNTMGSKADGLRVSELIITAKAELEKMREQVQNVE